MPPLESSHHHYDALIVGAGTSGMEAALTLGDMGHRVLLVEKEPSIGGKTILLSKVFPTLDCASCISTPKMAATAHHPNVTLMVSTEAEAVEKNDGRFRIRLRHRATSVHPDLCTGCGQCETACTVAVPDQYNYGLAARRAAHIPFPQAIPKKAVIEKEGSAPCHRACPAGVHASGFVSLVRSGKYREGFLLHLEDAPLVGVLSRACYAPCEGECTRTDLEGAVNIRAVKRFMSDRYYADHPEPEYGPPAERLNTRVAVVGSGPAGLAAAFYLARQGHGVTIFESQPEPGGMLRYGIPAYRLPREVVDRDIRNVTALGVEIKTNAKVESLAALQGQGFDGVVVAVGGQVPRIVPLAGVERVDQDDCMNFLSHSQSKQAEIRNRHVVVIGGGNVAMDVARSAVRLGAAAVSVLCLECRADMPAHPFEVVEAEEEGVNFHPASVTNRIFSGPEGPLLEFVQIHSFQMVEGKPSYQTMPGSERQIRADVVIMAVGLAPSTLPFRGEVELNRNQTIRADEETLETSRPLVFACGDAVMGPAIIVKSIGQGKRAAHYLDLKLKQQPLAPAAWMALPEAADKVAVLKNEKGAPRREPAAQRMKTPKERVASFEAYEGALTEAEARSAAGRCLDCAVCSQCLECVRVCPANAVDFGIRPRMEQVTASAVILAGGFEILDPAAKPLLGFGRYPDVLSAPQMDRLLAPTRPFNGVLRPSDGREPEHIAMVLCSGARDHTVCNPLCCRIGCMYALKQAQLLMGALPLAEVTIYYIDIRAFGKGYDEFFEQARGMGVKFAKGKVVRIEEKPGGGLLLHYEDMAAGAGPKTAEHDLAVLSVGLQPNRALLDRLGALRPETDEQGYVREAGGMTDPAATNVEGLFVAGAFPGGRDIPDAVLHAAATATQAARYLAKKENQPAGPAQEGR
ncbi:MAG: FAD-dependent oxidoreductase [candidate division FCPU426 bacterium]